MSFLSTSILISYNNGVYIKTYRLWVRTIYEKISLAEL